MTKPYSLKVTDKNKTSKAGGIIRDILASRRKGSTDSLPATFALFRSMTNIDPELEEATRGPKGDIIWHQAIRNVAKVHQNPKDNNKLMMSGEMFALVDGGFALPDHVPKGRTVIEFPIEKGFAVPTEKKKTASTKLKPAKRIGPKAVIGNYDAYDPGSLTASIKAEAHKQAAAIRRTVGNLRDAIRPAVVFEIRNDLEDGNYLFEEFGE